MQASDTLVEIPDDVRVVETADSVCYVLPIRDWPARWSAWILLAVGLLMVSVAFGMAMFLVSLPLGVTDAIFLTVGFVTGLLGVLLCLCGQNTLSGRVDLILRGEQLTTVSVTGKLRLPRRKTTRKLTQLLVMHDHHDAANAITPYPDKLSHIAYRIVLVYEDESRRVLVKWYAREHLEPIAHNLTDRLGLDQPVRVLMPPNIDDEDESDIVRPESSLIEVEYTKEGLSAMVPPMGLLRSSDGRSVGNLLGGGIAGAMAGAMAMLIFTPIGGFGWIWLLFSIPAFVGVLYVGVGLLGQRDTYIDIVHDELLVSTKGLHGVKQHQWSREQLKDITLGESVLEINDEHLPQLHIVPTEGEPLRLLTGRRQDEIRWLAHTLRKALHIESPKDDQPADKTEQ